MMLPPLDSSTAHMDPNTGKPTKDFYNWIRSLSNSVSNQLTTSSDNIWTGNQYFASGYPWFDVRAFGAVGNGSTDDTVAVQDAIDAANAIGGGTVYFPPGNYFLQSGVTVPNWLRLQGAGMVGTILTANTTDVTLLTINGSRVIVDSLMILGCNTTSTTKPAILVADNNNDAVKISNCYILFGLHGVQAAAQDTLIENCFVSSSYGNAICYITGHGQVWGIRTAFDQAYPVSQPSIGTAFPVAWAATTGYSVGDIRSTGGFFIQCSHAGTSGGGAPTVLTYGTTINDGTAKWLLVCPTSYRAVYSDATFTNENYFDQCDFSLSCTECILMIGSGAYLGISHCIFSDSINNAINLTAGNNATINSSEIFGGYANGSAITQNGLSHLCVTGNMIGKTLRGIQLSAVTSCVIQGNTFIGTTGSDVFVAAAVSNFIVNGNVGVSGITVSAGASDHYNIVNNVSMTVTDGGTGVNKTISGNV